MSKFTLDANTKDKGGQSKVEDEVQANQTPHVKIYSSLPIQSYRLGDFQFVKGMLELSNPKDIEKFEAHLAQMHSRYRRGIKTISLEVAEKLAAAHLSSSTKQIDSSAGRQALQDLQNKVPVVGTEPVDDSKA